MEEAAAATTTTTKATTASPTLTATRVCRNAFIALFVVLGLAWQQSYVNNNLSALDSTASKQRKMDVRDYDDSQRRSHMQALVQELLRQSGSL